MSGAPDHSSLLEIFPPTYLSADEIEGVYPEVIYYKRYFGGMSWPTVKRKYYEHENGALTMMYHGTLKHFIGGFLNTILTSPNSNSSLACDSLVNLASSQSFVKFCGVLTTQQAQFLITTIDWVIEDEDFNNKDRDRYFRNRETVTCRIFNE